MALASFRRLSLASALRFFCAALSSDDAWSPPPELDPESDSLSDESWSRLARRAILAAFFQFRLAADSGWAAAAAPPSDEGSASSPSASSYARARGRVSSRYCASRIACTQRVLESF